MKGINMLALLAVNFLAVVLVYRRHDFGQPDGVSSFWVPMLLAIVAFNLPAFLVSGVNYLINRKFNSSQFNSINYLVIGVILLVLFFPNFLKLS